MTYMTMVARAGLAVCVVLAMLLGAAVTVLFLVFLDDGHPPEATVTEDYF